jgi:peroxiredoxin
MAMRALTLVLGGLAVTAAAGCGDDRGIGGSGEAGVTSGSGASTASSSSSAGVGGSGPGPGSGAGGSTAWGERYCPEPPPGVTVGTAVGQQFPALTVRDCDDHPVSLDAFCGADAMFLFAMHIWCPICQSVSTSIEQIHDGYAGQNLATVLVVIADATDCQNVRDQHGHADVVTLYDPDGVIEPIWSGSSALSAYLDADRVITGKLVHDGSEAAIEAEIDEALGN